MDFQNQHTQDREEGSQNFSRSSQIPIRGTAFQRPAHIPSAANFQRDIHSPGEEQTSEVKPKKIIAILEIIITVCLAALFFGLPLFFTGLSLQGISFEKQMYFYFWFLLALVAWVSKGVVVGEMKIRRTPLDIPILLLWATYGIAIFFSVDKWHSFWGFFGDPSRGFMNVTALVIVFYLIVSHFDAKRFIWMGAGLIAADFILAIWSFLLFMGVPLASEKFSKFIPLSFIGSLTGLGIFLGAMLPFIVAFILGLNKGENKKNSPKKITILILLFVTLVFNLVVLLIMYSFVSWLGVLVGVSFFLVYILAQIVRPSENWTWLPMLVFVAILAILMIGNNTFSRIQLPLEVSPSYQLSLDVAKNSLKNNFLIGSGPATYGYDFSLYKPQNFNLNPYYNLRFFQASGIFFESLSTIGAIGTVLLVLLTLTFLSVGVYLLSTDKKRNKLYSLGIFSAGLVIVINAYAGKIEGAVLIIGVLVSSLAIAMLMSESETEENYLALSLKASPKYALALAFVFMIVSAGVVFLFIFIGKIYVADLQAGRAIRENSITADGSVKKLMNVLTWNNKESRYYTILGQELMSLANEETLKGEKERNLGLIQEYLNNSIAAVNQARNLAPKDVAAVEALAQIYENSGLYVSDSFALSEENYKKALELEPHNPVYLVKLGQIKLAQASNKKTQDEAKALVSEAKDWFQKAVDEKNNLAVAHYQLALAQEALGKFDEAVKSIEQAAILEQDNLNYIFNVARIHQARGNDDDLKIAEAVYKNILSKNDKEINTHFSLGLLYEKTKRSNEATAEYKKVIELLPSDTTKDVKERIQKMISNIAKGIENKPENLKLESDAVPVAPVSASETPTPADAAATQPVVPAPTPAPAVPSQP